MRMSQRSSRLGERSRPRKSKSVTKPPPPDARKLFPRRSAPSTNSTKTTTQRKSVTLRRTSTYLLSFCNCTGSLTVAFPVRQQESEYLASFSDSLSAGTTWSRICNYIELENSQSKTLARTGAGTTDLTRFKEVLLRLKREGEAAPGAAGY